MHASYSDDPRMSFFDKLAHRWNEMQNFPRQEKLLTDFLHRHQVSPDETIMDIGCGTGTLTRVLLRYLSGLGCIKAVDFSREMLRIAQAGIQDARVTWHHASAEHTPLIDKSLDRIICFSAWPHFRQPQLVINEWKRLLKPRGHAHIIHLISRAEVNHIHTNTDDQAVHHDLLAPVAEVAALFQHSGFQLLEQSDTAENYLLSVRKSC